jgi:hypothetical protein
MLKEAPPGAQNYAAQAKSMRALAERATSAEVKVQLLRLAQLYEKLAKVAENFVLRSLSAAASIATSSAPEPKPPKEGSDKGAASSAPSRTL